ncbi:MAG: hypothetical protein HZB55_07220 [Deltaproteobacteria bacterium]|nr:hypothetical protein [Deltaproteobacteria bacterium]
MSKSWSVMPGIGVGGGGGPLEGTVTNFQITKPDGSSFSAVFCGAGGSLGGPASFTYSDRATPGYAGNIIWAWGLQPDELWLKNPNDGLILSVGTAPRQFLQYFGMPQDPTAISGYYLMILGFGVTSAPAVSIVGLVQDSVAAASILADIKFQTQGKLLGGVRAYAAVASAAKGVDVGGVAAMTGKWLFL